MTTNIKYGCTTITRAFPAGTTIGAIISDPDVKAELGYADSVRATVGGVEMPDGAIAPDGGTIVIATRANSKA